MPAVRARIDDAPAALAIAAVAFGVRLAWVLAAGVTPTDTFDDALWYHRAATLLANGHGFVSPLTGQPTAAWPPGYSFLLSLLYRMTGPSPTAAGVANALFGAATCVLVWRLGARLGGRPVGLGAAALVAVYPGQILFVPLVLSETLFTCLVCALLVAATALLDPAEEHDPRWWLAWGVGVGLTSLVRAESLALVLVPLATRAGRDRRAVVAVALGAMLALAPWTLRNARVFGAFVPTSTGFGRTLWIGHNPIATGGMTTDIQAAMQRRMAAGGLTPATPADELAVDRGLRADAVAFALAHPARELVLTPLRTYHLFRGDHVWQAWYGPGTPRIAPSERARRILGLACNLAYAALGALALVGWLRRPPATRSAWRPVVAFGVVWVAIFTAIYGDPRFHHVLIPIACILAAIAIVRPAGTTAA